MKKEKNILKIDAVVVTYNPKSDLLDRSIKSFLNSVRCLYLVDNNSDRLRIYINDNKIKVIKLNENKGIAYAQNIGIKMSLENGSDFILLSDQDTIFPKNYVQNMIKSISDIEKVAAIIPLFKDINKKKKNEGFIKKSFVGFRKFYPTSGLHEVFQAIASGVILNSKYIKDIGLMDEKLFIDWVDLEWCWRARKKGYKIIGNADVIITHQLGDKAASIGFREVNIRSPIRHYYITRNAFYLALRDDSLDKFHKITLFFKSFKYILGFPVLSKPHLKHLKYTLLGFWHGITKKLGKLDD